MSYKYIEQLNQLIIERKLFSPDTRILIGISGGQDSILLLNLLYHLKDFWNWNMGIIYCDHQWYSRSFNHAQCLYSLALNMGLSSYFSIPCEELGKNEKKSREWRSLIIERIASMHTYNAIALGHNSSDKIETLIYHSLRGSGLKGLISLNWIRPVEPLVTLPVQVHRTLVGHLWCLKEYYWSYFVTKRKKFHSMTIVRPLLNFTRHDIYGEVSRRELPLCLDSSNYTLQFRRNRIRHQLLPYLRKYFNPKIDLVLRNLADICEFEVLYIDAIIDAIFSSKYITSYNENKIHCSFSTPCWHGFPIAIQRRILTRILSKQGIVSINFAQIENIRLAFNNVHNLSHRRIILTKGMMLKINFNKIIIEHNLDIIQKLSYNSFIGNASIEGY